MRSLVDFVSAHGCRYTSALLLLLLLPRTAQHCPSAREATTDGGGEIKRDSFVEGGRNQPPQRQTDRQTGRAAVSNNMNASRSPCFWHSLWSLTASLLQHHIETNSAKYIFGQLACDR